MYAQLCCNTDRVIYKMQIWIGPSEDNFSTLMESESTEKG